MSTAAAIKQARYRQRQRHPWRCIYRAEVERDRFLAALVRSGWLEAAKAQQRDQVEMALSLMPAVWVDETVRA